MTIWLISDTHFGHANILTFALRNGQPMRDFANVQEMDETMIERWNSAVKPSDHVYHLGDVCMKKEHLAIVKHLNGHKRLVRGNHDIFRTKDYINAGFEEIHGCRVFEEMMLTHVPIHPLSMKEGWINCHGHVHNNILCVGERYVNCCVEVLNYRPITLEEARKKGRRDVSGAVEGEVSPTGKASASGV